MNLKNYFAAYALIILYMVSELSVITDDKTDINKYQLTKIKNIRTEAYEKWTHIILSIALQFLSGISDQVIRILVNFCKLKEKIKSNKKDIDSCYWTIENYNKSSRTRKVKKIKRVPKAELNYFTKKVCDTFINESLINYYETPGTAFKDISISLSDRYLPIKYAKLDCFVLKSMNDTGDYEYESISKQKYFKLLNNL